MQKSEGHMETVNERNEAPEQSNVYCGNGVHNENQDRGACMTYPTGGEVGADEEVQSGRHRNKFGRLMLTPFRLIGKGVKKAVGCCFQCRNSEQGGVVPVVEVVEDHNPVLGTSARDEARISPVEHEEEKNENKCNSAELHENGVGALENRSFADTGSDSRGISRTSSHNEEKCDREALKEIEEDATESEGLPAPVVVKKACAIVNTTADDENHEVERSTSRSDVAGLSESESVEVEDATPEIPIADVRRTNEDSTEYESSDVGRFTGALIKEEVAMTTDNEDLHTEEESEACSYADNGGSFQDDSCLQFFASNPNESSDGSEYKSRSSSRTLVTSEDVMSDRSSEGRSKSSLTEGGEESSTSTSASDSFDSDQSGVSVENRDEEDGMHNSSTLRSPECVANDVSSGNEEGIASSSCNPAPSDRSPSAQTVEEGENNCESNESQEGDSMFGFVLSKLRSVITSFRGGNSEDEEQNSNEPRVERTIIENETSSNGYESEVETETWSGSSSPQPSSADDGLYQNDTSSRDSLESTLSGESLEGPGSGNHRDQEVASRNSFQGDGDDDDDVPSVPRSNSSIVASFRDSDGASDVVSSDVGESFEDSDHSSQIAPSSSGSFDESDRSSQMPSPASAESFVDSDHSSQVVTSSSADMLTDSDKMDFEGESD
ncbi:adhesin [Gracilaria domingensis]|nr:adhesin [Gracilaria domingensis]